MALTQNTYTGDGSTVLFSFTFPYLTTTDIKVSVNGVDTTAYSLANATTVQFSSAPANGAAIRIFRDTNVDSLNAEFFSGSAIRASDLNNDFNQILYSTQETVNRRVESTGGDMTGDLTMVNADIVFEGSTNDANETTLTVVDPTADRTITLPNVSGTVVTTGDTGTVSTGMVADSAITSAKIANGTIVDADIASNAELSVSKLQDGSARQLLQTNANGNDVEWASNIDIPGTLDVAGATTLDSGVSVTGNITVSGTVDGRDVAADGTKLDGIESGATGDQTAAEIRTLVESASDSNVFTDADHTKLNAIESGATADQTAAEIRSLVGNANDSNVYTDAHYNLVNGITATSAEINKLDGVTASTSELNVTDGITATTSEINILDGVTSNASELNTLDGITASTAELNQLDGKTISSTFTPANSNDIPTSAAINTYVSGLLNSLGGFVAISNENSFPTTNPDPSDNAGTIVSIANAGGMSINGSGVGSGQTTAGTAVTITGFPSTFNNTTIQDGLGLQVQTTSTLNTYTYHKVYAKDEDVRQLSQDVNDFKARYRVGASNPTTDLDSGDLFFNTGSGKMLVYNGQNSAWEEVQSIGEFFINTFSSSSGTGGGSATFNGSAYRFTLSNAPTNAEQLLVSVNGVVQKPNSGTSQPSEGFALDGSDIIFSAAPATNSPFFVITIGSSVNIGTPSAGTVGTAQLATSAVTNAKISSTAAIASSKLAKPIDFADNEEARFGTDNDLRIKHDGSQNVINSFTANPLNIISNGDTSIKTNNNENMAVFKKNGAVELYNDNNKKLETKSDGIDVTGEVQCDSLDVDGNADISGNSVKFGNYTFNSNTTSGVEVDTGSLTTQRASSSGASARAHAHRFGADIKYELKNDGSAYFAGNVGIGYDGPNAKLLVYQGSDNATDVAIFTGGSQLRGLKLGTKGYNGYNDGGVVYNAQTGGNAGSHHFQVNNGVDKVKIDVDGLKFGSDTAAANALDDYEEGTFIPSITGTTQGTAALDTSVDRLAYTKIGRAVHITGRIRITSVNGVSGGLIVGNLPFPHASGLTAHADYGMLHVYLYKTDYPADAMGPVMVELSQSGSTNGTIYYVRDDANWPVLPASAFDSGDVYMHINGTYIVS